MSESDTQRLEQLLQFHERDPKDAFITYGIAMEYLKAGNPERAIEWFDRKSCKPDGYRLVEWFREADIEPTTGVVKE